MRRLINNPWFQICAVVAVVSAVLTVRNQIVFSAYFGQQALTPPDASASNPSASPAAPPSVSPSQPEGAQPNSGSPSLTAESGKEGSAERTRNVHALPERDRSPAERSAPADPARATSPGGVAEFETGMKHYEGIGVPKSFRLAITYLRQSAEAGNSRAMAKLGWMYWFGEGVDPDAAAGATWYQRGARAGDAEAQYWLAIFYDKGYGGLQKSRPRAMEWMRKAAQQGFNDAVKATQPGGAFAP